MSAIPYAAPIVNSTFTQVVGTRGEIVSGIETALTAAGWSTISGGGTGNVIMKTAVTPAPKSNSIRVRLSDADGGGGRMSLFIRNDAGTLESMVHTLQPTAGKTWRVIACPYFAWVMVDGSLNNYEFAAFGTHFIPDFLNGVVTADLGILSASDDTLRTALRPRRSSQIINGALLNVNDFFAARNITLSFFSSPWGAAQIIPWHDDSLSTYQVEISYAANGVEFLKTRGLLYNAMIVRGQFALDDVSIGAYDGHAWRVISSWGANEYALAVAIT